MNMKASVLKPGLLVALRTTVRGGVDYRRITVEADHDDGAGARLARWETTRYIPNPEEYERANAARGKARALIAAACCPSAFGLLCPSADEGELQEAIAAARRVAEVHNDGAELTRVEVYVLVGRVAQDDAEAVRAISAEMRDLLEAMQAGIKAADPQAIRDAASKARAMGGMLSEDVLGKVKGAIAEARTAAREIAKRVARSGEDAAKVVAELSFKAIDAARFSFLDLDEATVTREAPAAPALDVPAAGSEPSSIQKAQAPQLALEV